MANTLSMVPNGVKSTIDKLSMSQLFFHSGCFWIKSDTYSGTQIVPDIHSSAEPIKNYGSCSFCTSEDEWLEIELVTVTVLSNST